MTTTRIRPCGEAALLLDCADLAEAVALAERIERAQTGAVDVVAAARTVLVTARQASELPQLRRALEPLLAPPHNPLSPGVIRYPYRSSGSVGGVADEVVVDEVVADSGDGAATSGGVVTLDVRYDGPDLADVAELAGVSTEALVRMHTSITWKAAFGGFSPGFFYLVDARELGAPDAATAGHGARPQGAQDAGLGPGPGDGLGHGSGSGSGLGPGPLPTVPRLDSPRPRVPAGSVAMADRFCAVYPGASPGGWRLLGTTDARLWDVDQPQPAMLAPGTLVRFRDLGGGAAP